MEYKTGFDGLRWLCLILLVFQFGTASVCAQANLVPNPSFEEYDFCSNFSQGSGWPDQWVIPEMGLTPDYYNSCSQVSGVSVPDNSFGTQTPKSGDAYVGGYTYSIDAENVRDFLSVPLLDTLRENSKYVFTAYFSLADDVNYCVARLGALLTLDVPVSPQPIYEMPASAFNSSPMLTDKVGWVKFSDTILAAGGESWLTIGGFFNDSLIDTSYVGGGNPGWNFA